MGMTRWILDLRHDRGNAQACAVCNLKSHVRLVTGCGNHPLDAGPSVPQRAEHKLCTRRNHDAHMSQKAKGGNDPMHAKSAVKGGKDMTVCCCQSGWNTKRVLCETMMHT